MGKGFAMALAGGLTGFGDGLVAYQAQLRQDAQRAMETQTRQAEMLQRRAWQVEDRDLAFARRGGGGRGGGGGGAAPAGTAGQPAGIPNLAWDPKDPAEVKSNKIRAYAKAQNEGREVTWDDYNWAASTPQQPISPGERARLIDSQMRALSEDYRNRNTPRDELERQAVETVDRFLTAPAAEAAPAGAEAGALGQPDANAPAAWPIPNNRQISYLRNNPGTAAQFEELFGPGSAEKYLN